MTSFGFGIVTAQRDPRADRSDAEIYADVLDLAVRAEQLGFDAIWMSEHHFVDDGYMSSLLPVGAAIAARTSTIRIGTGIIVAPLHHPLRLAEDAATVDLLSRGRLTLGLGAGYREEEFAGLGVPFEKPGARLEASVGVLRDAWSDGVARASESTLPVSVTPKPFRLGGPPIWLGARQRIGIDRAARLADGFLAARVTPQQFGEQVALFRERLEAAGRRPEEVTVSVHCPVFAWPGGGAWERLREHFHYIEWKYRDMVDQPYGQRAGVEQQVPPLSTIDEEQLKSGALVGTPEQVAAQIGEFCDVAGEPFHFIARLYWPGMDPALQREALDVYAEQVIPAVEGR
jgi:alkanesulfonate monooxygenase SsuD/methylene tetrahydromethanopterin reductase-like flavin-dependent oxidoreductase (luciferase family)